MDIKEQLKDIKTQLRLSMNGAVSQSMREKGLVYKLNFGVEIPRIKMIVEGYEKNHDLAQALWKEDIRECKIMAAMLQPVDTFYPEIADIWVESIRNIEIAELPCMNLFQHLPDGCPSFDEKGRYDRKSLRRIARSGTLRCSFRKLSCAECSSSGYP